MHTDKKQDKSRIYFLIVSFIFFNRCASVLKTGFG
jgi:hypothetical protein